jgi:acyl dehydratase
MHGLCTYGFSGRALIAELGDGDAGAITAVDARFTKPVFPGETLTTLIWRTEPGKAVFRTEASGVPGPAGIDARLVLEDGAVEYTRS